MLVNKNECILAAVHGSARLVWFDDKTSILYFIDKPFNNPRWEYGTITTQQDALEMYNALKRDNWELTEDRLESIIPKLRP